MKKWILLSLLLALPAAAQLPPAGTDFQVNVETRGSQESPDVARDAAGNFVVVWASPPPAAIRARLFHASGEPASGDIVVAEQNGLISSPRVAATPQGAFVVVWGDSRLVYLRRFDRLGRPAGNGVQVSPVTLRNNVSPDVVVDAAGNAIVVWIREEAFGDQVVLRRFDAADQPQGDPERVNQYDFTQKLSPRIARNAAGSLLVTWEDTPGVWARRFDGPSGVWTPEAQVNGQAFTHGSAPVLHPAGDGLVAYLDSGNGKVFMRRVDPTGSLGPPVEIGSNLDLYSPIDAAVGPNGTVLVAWSQYSPATKRIQVYGRFLDRVGTPLDEPFLVSSASQVFDLQAAVAGGPGGFTVAWANGDFFDGFFPGIPPPLLDGRDGDEWGIFAQRFSAGRCEAGSDVLCLHDGRFEVRARWKANGEEGKGRALALSSDTGALWFFQRENLELMIKVLDARAVNGSFWVYLGALSDVEYTVEVTDTVTRTTRTYRNPPGRQASQADIDDFADPVGSPGQDAAKATLELPLASLKAEGLCQPSPTALCLGEGRFRVEVELTDPRTNTEKQAVAVPLTADTGAFWFFNAENLELMIKILDGRANNGHFWIYYGALSDVAYTITVTDTQTGEHETYENQPGRLVSRSDVEAF